jgi:hypothetical protein
MRARLPLSRNTIFIQYVSTCLTQLQFTLDNCMPGFRMLDGQSKNVRIGDPKNGILYLHLHDKGSPHFSYTKKSSTLRYKNICFVDHHSI